MKFGAMNYQETRLDDQVPERLRIRNDALPLSFV
jgi:hypothetical protein